MKRNITFILFLLGLLILFFVYKRYPLDSNPRTLQHVIKKTFKCPDSKIIQLEEGSEALYQVLNNRYDTSFTPEALDDFIKQRYGDNYHFLANKGNKQVVFDALTIKKDLDNPITYYFDIALEVVSPNTATLKTKVTGSAQFIEHKIVSIYFEDQGLLALLRP